MLGAVGPLAEAAPLVARFRREAARGRRLLEGRGHRDGWGVTVGAAHVGRSARDAEEDPAFEEAARRVAGTGRGVAMVHLRAASAGAVDVGNAHPFVADGLAFCHNGTIHGLAPAGESDSRAYFARVLDGARRGLAPPDALAEAARALDAACTHSSLTALLTDGRTLWGLRKVGDDPVECADRACAEDYYALGISRVGGLAVVAQEHEFLGMDAPWAGVPDGHLVQVDARGRVETWKAL